MPIYEYECKSCGQVIEAVQKFSDAPLQTCTACNQGPLVKLISRTNFHLKGTGWYATDYKKTQPCKPAASEPEQAKAKGDGQKDGAEPVSKTTDNATTSQAQGATKGSEPPKKGPQSPKSE